MDIETLSYIVKKLVNQTRGIQDAVLISEEAELITDPIGEWDEVFITNLAEQILDFTDKTHEHLGSSFLEQIWLQTEENHFIVVYCNNKVFLLVKASNNARLGSLRNATNDAVKALEITLNSEVIIDPEEMSQDSYNEDYLHKETNYRRKGKWRGRE